MKKTLTLEKIDLFNNFIWGIINENGVIKPYLCSTGIFKIWYTLKEKDIKVEISTNNPKKKGWRKFHIFNDLNSRDGFFVLGLLYKKYRFLNFFYQTDLIIKDLYQKGHKEVYIRIENV